MKKKTLISVVIVTWNSSSDICNCISSVINSLSEYETEIIVVDNKSSDNTTSIVKRKFPTVKLLKLQKNIGFGHGNNVAIRQSKGKFILLLNPDTVVNTHALETMLAYLNNNPTVGAVGPEQFNDKNHMIFMASRVSFFGIFEYIIEYLYKKITNRSKILFPWPHKTYMLNGGCIFIRSTVLPTRDWFDPDCFMYGEEQFLFKQIAEYKWGVYFLRNCSIIHLREKSIMQTTFKNKFVVDSAKVLIKKSPIGRLIFG